MNITKKYRDMCAIYKIFASQWECDLSLKAMREMFEFESCGNGEINIAGFNTIGIKPNGYAVGKKWLNVQVTAWKEEIARGGCRAEFLLQQLFTDPLFLSHHNWLNKVLGLK